MNSFKKLRFGAVQLEDKHPRVSRGACRGWCPSGREERGGSSLAGTKGACARGGVLECIKALAVCST